MVTFPLKFVGVVIAAIIPPAVCDVELTINIPLPEPSASNTPDPVNVSVPLSLTVVLTPTPSALLTDMLLNVVAEPVMDCADTVPLNETVPLL